VRYRHAGVLVAGRCEAAGARYHGGGVRRARPC
jgi:hypothetical protein